MTAGHTALKGWFGSDSKNLPDWNVFGRRRGTAHIPPPQIPFWGKNTWQLNYIRMPRATNTSLPQHIILINKRSENRGVKFHRTEPSGINGRPASAGNIEGRGRDSTYPALFYSLLSRKCFPVDFEVDKQGQS